jgi:hypothetical protein
MKYRIVIVERDDDGYPDTYIYGKYKYKKAEDAEGDAKALKQSLNICGIKADVKAEGTT